MKHDADFTCPMCGSDWSYRVRQALQMPAPTQGKLVHCYGCRMLLVGEKGFLRVAEPEEIPVTHEWDRHNNLIVSLIQAEGIEHVVWLLEEGLLADQLVLVAPWAKVTRAKARAAQQAAEDEADRLARAAQPTFGDRLMLELKKGQG